MSLNKPMLPNKLHKGEFSKKKKKSNKDIKKES